MTWRIVRREKMLGQRNASLVVTAVNLLTIGGAILANQSSYGLEADQKIEKLNVASLKSIESTWLKMPMACKARGFNADPMPLEVKQLNPQIQGIYASFTV
jgi:hypothetical protein